MHNIPHVYLQKNGTENKASHMSRLSSHHDYNLHPNILAFGNTDSINVDCLSYLSELFHYLHSHTC